MGSISMTNLKLQNGENIPNYTHTTTYNEGG